MLWVVAASKKATVVKALHSERVEAVDDENQAYAGCGVRGGLRVAAVRTGARAMDQLPDARNPSHGRRQAKLVGAGPQDSGRETRSLRNVGAPERAHQRV